VIVRILHHDFPTSREALTHVADITVPDTAEVMGALETAWRRTNNINGSWSRGPSFEDGSTNHDFHESVTVHAPLPVHKGQTYGLRSSMVGDVFEVAGRRFRVAMMGFTEERA
jgi:hypothetical protein